MSASETLLDRIRADVSPSNGTPGAKLMMLDNVRADLFRREGGCIRIHMPPAFKSYRYPEESQLRGVA